MVRFRLAAPRNSSIRQPRNGSVAGGLFFDRFGHSATRLADGRVLVAGGLTSDQTHNFSLASVELFDPQTANWFSAGKLNVARRYHTASLLADGRVLAVGGVDQDLYSGGYQKLSSTEIYDPAAFVWTVAGDLVAGRSSHTETPLRSGLHPIAGYRLLVAGGDDAPAYANSLSSAELFTYDQFEVIPHPPFLDLRTGGADF